MSLNKNWLDLTIGPHFEDWNDSINDSRLVIHQSLTNTVVQIVDSVNRHYRPMKTCSVRSKRRDHYQSDNREKNDKTKPFIHIINDD